MSHLTPPGAQTTDALSCPDTPLLSRATAVVMWHRWMRNRLLACRYFLVADTIAHEMSHLWCGDLVTPTWWSDLWLNVRFTYS